MASPLISIIIPTKNAGKYLLDCLKSIELQSYSKLEVIVIDSLSTDNTKNIVSDSQIVNKSLSESDSGIYDAMNKGINLASGDWILFLGADDRIYSAFILEKIIKDLTIKESKQKKIDMIICNSICNNNIINNTFNYRLLKGNSLNHQGVIYSKNIFENNFYDINYKYAADYKLNLQLFKKKINVLKLNYILSVYGDKGLSTTNYIQGQKEEYAIRIEVFGFLCGNIINLFVIFKNKLKYVF
jgi:glycosyltransferase involved in cell wall biosynthesis